MSPKDASMSKQIVPDRSSLLTALSIVKDLVSELLIFPENASDEEFIVHLTNKYKGEYLKKMLIINSRLNGKIKKLVTKLKNNMPKNMSKKSLFDNVKDAMNVFFMKEVKPVVMTKHLHNKSENTKKTKKQQDGGAALLYLLPTMIPVIMISSFVAIVFQAASILFVITKTLTDKNFYYPTTI